MRSSAQTDVLESSVVYSLRGREKQYKYLGMNGSGSNLRVSLGTLEVLTDFVGQLITLAIVQCHRTFDTWASLLALRYI